MQGRIDEGTRLIQLAIGYADFFEPPKEELRLAGKGKGKEEKGKGKGQGGGKKKGKGKRVAFEEDDDVELDNGDDDEDEQDGARDVMGRLKGDLFDDDEEEEEDEGSTYICTAVLAFLTRQTSPHIKNSN